MDREYNSQIEDLHKAVHLLIFKTIIQNKNKYPHISELNRLGISIVNRVSKDDNTIIKDLVNSLNVPKSTLTSAINKLENQNILKREINPNDKRSYRLVLTEKGKAIKKEHDDIERKGFKKIMDSLDGHDEREEFIRLLNKIAQRL